MFYMQDQRESLQRLSSPKKQVNDMISNDPSKRNKIVRVLLQALRSLGFLETARQLQKESEVGSQQKIIDNIKNLLNKESYQQIPEELVALNLPSSIKENMSTSLNQLKIINLVRRGDHDMAIEEIAKSQFSEQKKMEFYEKIALGSQRIIEKQAKQKEESFLQRCNTQSVDSRGVDRIIKGFINDHTPFQQVWGQPPTKIVAQSFQRGRYRNHIPVTFLKFNIRGDKIALLGEGRRQFELSVWHLQNKNIEQKYYLKSTGYKNVNSVKWSQNNQIQCIGVCSFENLQIYTAIQKILCILTIDARQQNIGRLLCFAWHYNSNLLYIGGLFQQIKSYNQKGILVNSITPFMQTRQLLIVKDNIYAISAIKGQLIKYSINSQKQIAQFKQNQPFMDLKYYQQTHNILATTNRNVFIIDPYTLNVTHAIEAPQNQQLFKIQAFLCNGWLLIFNQRLIGHLQGKRIDRVQHWSNYSAVDVFQSKLATFGTTIQLMQGCEPQIVQDKQEESLSEFNIVQEEGISSEISSQRNEIASQLQSQSQQSQPSISSGIPSEYFDMEQEPQ